MYDWEEDLYLAHFGVKGMKWGVRKRDLYRDIKKAASTKSGKARNDIATKNRKLLEKEIQASKKLYLDNFHGVHDYKKGSPEYLAIKRGKAYADKILGKYGHIKVTKRGDASDYLAGLINDIGAGEATESFRLEQLK